MSQRESIECMSVFTWYPAPGYLHVELNGVHTQDGVAHVAEQVACGNNSGEGW